MRQPTSESANLNSRRQRSNIRLLYVSAHQSPSPRGQTLFLPFPFFFLSFFNRAVAFRDRSGEARPMLCRPGDLPKPSYCRSLSEKRGGLDPTCACVHWPTVRATGQSCAWSVIDTHDHACQTRQMRTPCRLRRQHCRGRGKFGPACYVYYEAGIATVRSTISQR